MSHFIVMLGDLYQYPRRATGRVYESRTCWGNDLAQARVFNTRGAARNSSKGQGQVIQIYLAWVPR